MSIKEDKPDKILRFGPIGNQRRSRNSPKPQPTLTVQAGAAFSTEDLSFYEKELDFPKGTLDTMDIEQFHKREAELRRQNEPSVSFPCTITELFPNRSLADTSLTTHPAEEALVEPLSLIGVPAASRRPLDELLP